MRLVNICIVLAALLNTAGAAIAKGTAVKGDNSGGTGTSLAVASFTAAANALVVVTEVYNPNSASSLFNAPNTLSNWSRCGTNGDTLNTSSAAGVNMEFWFGFTTGGLSAVTITATYSGSGERGVMTAQSYTGTAATNANPCLGIGATSTCLTTPEAGCAFMGDTGFVTSATATSNSTSHSNSLYFAVLAMDRNSGTISAGSGYAIDVLAPQVSTCCDVAYESKSAAVATAANTAFSFSWVNSGHVNMRGAEILAAAASSPVRHKVISN